MAPQRQAPRIAELPFDPELRFAATLHRRDGGLVAAVKGAGERLLPMCTTMAGPEGDLAIDAAGLSAQAHALAARVSRAGLGQWSPAPSERTGNPLTAADLQGLCFLGFVCMIDPLRPEAAAAIAACQAAGVQVAMVTGDHPATALAIARELGFAERPEQVVTGATLAAASAEGEAAVDALVRSARVFARVEPTQKLQIVQSLGRLGHFVAVTGDGANDAPRCAAAHRGRHGPARHRRCQRDRIAGDHRRQLCLDRGGHRRRTHLVRQRSQGDLICRWLRARPRCCCLS